MTATILPEIVQPAFGLRNLMSALWLATKGPVGPGFHGGLLKCWREKVCFHQSAALPRWRQSPRWRWRWLNRRWLSQARHRQARATRLPRGPAARQISARGAGTIAVVAELQQPPRLPASLVRAWRSPPPRTAASTMIPTAITVTVRCI